MMDSVLASSTFINHDSSSTRQSSSKVLAWLEENLSTLTGSCECCQSRNSCSFHATSCLAVRGKVLEDRLLKLNQRRRSLEQRNELLDERRRKVVKMALKIRNMSGSTLDGRDLVTPDVSLTKEHSTPDVIPGPISGHTRTSFTDIQGDDTAKPRTGLKTIRSALKKMTSIVRSRPEMKTMTTQTSSSLLTRQTDVITQQLDIIECQDDISESDLDLITHYTKEGLKCTWC